MADMAYYDSLEAADMAGDPAASSANAQAASIAAAAAEDARAAKAHDEEVGQEDPLVAAFRKGKSDAMASGGRL